MLTFVAVAVACVLIIVVILMKTQGRSKVESPFTDQVNTPDAGTSPKPKA